LSFINPIFLFALGAAILPVLYHLVRRMKAKKVPFSSLMFLKASPKELIKKRRFRDLLLMAIRTVIFALLAFAFARPYIPRERIPFLPQHARQSVVFLVDNSYSMQYGDLFEDAKQEVLDRLNAAGNDDEFSIIAFSDDAHQLTPLSDNLVLHRNVINTLLVSNRSTDFYQPLRLAEEMLQDARFDRKSIVLISDFQRNGWTGSLENWKLERDIDFIPIRIGDSNVHNVFVQEFELTKRQSGDETLLRLDARVASTGRYTGLTKMAELSVGEDVVDRQTLPAVSSTKASFQRMSTREGFVQGSLTIGSDDGLEIDNRYHFTYPVEPRPTVLAVGDPTAGNPSDVFFLRNVFDMGDGARYTFVSRGPQSLSPAYLRDYQVVFLANISSLSPGRLTALRQYVNEGGNLVLSFGERTDINMFSDHLQLLGIGRIEETVLARSVQAYEAIIGEVDLRHPVFSIFAGSGTGAILKPKFRRYMRVIPDSGAVVLGRYDTDDAFLIEHSMGDGKVLVYTSTLNTNWTDFPVNEMYVPFVYQMVQYMLSSGGERYLYEVGDVVPVRGNPGDEWDVRTPAGDVFKVIIDAFGQGYFRETEDPGQYVAAVGRSQFFFSVNIDVRESELAYRDQQEVYAAIVPPTEDLTTSPERAETMAFEDEESRQKLWRYVLLLILGLFAFETYYANRKRSMRHE